MTMTARKRKHRLTSDWLVEITYRNGGIDWNIDEAARRAVGRPSTGSGVLLQPIPGDKDARKTLPRDLSWNFRFARSAKAARDRAVVAAKAAGGKRVTSRVEFIGMTTKVQCPLCNGPLKGKSSTDSRGREFRICYCGVKAWIRPSATDGQPFVFMFKPNRRIKVRVVR